MQMQITCINKIALDMWYKVKGEQDETDQEIEASLEGVKIRKFIVYHPAFGYLAEDYGLQMYALEEEGKESTIQHLKEMIDLAKRENIKEMA